MISLPRLEFGGAEHASKLAFHSEESSRLYFTQSLHAWTDFTIALHWLSRLHKTRKTFVQNRVSEIQKIQPRSDWKHVPSEENPADLASRGCSANVLVKSTLWWSGPSWLTAPEATWPDLKVDVPEPPEMSKTAHYTSQ